MLLASTSSPCLAISLLNASVIARFSSSAPITCAMPINKSFVAFIAASRAASTFAILDSTLYSFVISTDTAAAAR